MAADYPSFSDYSYVAGNPVIFIDPDGKKIKISGKKEFKRQVRAHLKTIAMTEAGRQVVQGLRTTKNVHRFIATSGKSKVVPTNSKGSTSKSIANSPESKKKALPEGLKTERSKLKMKGAGGGTGSIIKINPNNAVEGGNMLSTIGHEIQHSYDIEKGQFNPNRIDPIGEDNGIPEPEVPGAKTGVKFSELKAVQFENHVRANNNIPLRDVYNEGVKDGKRTGLSQMSVEEYKDYNPNQ